MPEAKTLTREFSFSKNGTKVVLPDPNPEFSVQEVLNFYSSEYPQLTTATVEEPTTEGKTQTYKVKETVGTKH